MNKNSVAVITGAASGIGRALAIRFAKENIAGIAISDWNETGLLETAAEIQTIGVPVSSHVIDVSKLDQVQRFTDKVIERHGRVTHLVNNAGVGLFGTFEQVSITDIEWLMGVNFWGVVYGCKAFLPMLQASKGKIINIASMAALMQAPAMSNYNVAKAGVVALSESLLVELHDQEVSVHVVCPSFFQTNLLDSFRGPTPAMKAQIGRLLEKSPITAADIADCIFNEVAKGEFMILPHEEGRMAWDMKRRQPQAMYDEMTLMCAKMRAKAQKGHA